MIEIEIRGSTAIGKSSLAVFLLQKLTEAGFSKIELNMLDDINEKWLDSNNLRIEQMVAKDMPIRIVERCVSKNIRFTDS